MSSCDTHYQFDKVGVVTMMSCSLNELKARKFDMINIITHSENEFFSFIMNDDELTIYYSKSLDCYVSQNIKALYKLDFICYKITNLCDLIDESGCINRITTYFSQKKIPILYLTSYNNDNILVPIEFGDQIDKYLQNETINCQK